VSTGFENEDKIKLAINNKKFEDLNNNLQEMIKYSFSNYNGVIKCSKQAGGNKSDLSITIGNETHTYSIKKGTGNSVHQEPVEQFISFLENNYRLDIQVKNDIRLFIWGDGTLDGKGNKKDRVDARTFKNNNLNSINRLIKFFNTIKIDLIKRFVISGAECSNHSSEYIYYGDDTKGICCLSEKALTWLSNNTCRGTIPIGRLSFQAWNRAIDGEKSEHKRGVIQLKWGTIKDDIEKAKNA
jgi:hypothetical protein